MAITYTGTHITLDYGAPSVRDLAVQSMRIFRYGGASRIPWPDGMHAMFVADILIDRSANPKMEAYGLLHDAAEIVVGDVCQPFKTDAARRIEAVLQHRIYNHFGLALPNQLEQSIVKEADRIAVAVEGELLGPRGFHDWWRGEPFQAGMYAGALTMLDRYLTRFLPSDCLDADGANVQRYEHRLRCAIVRALGSTPYEREIPK